MKELIFCRIREGAPQPRRLPDNPQCWVFMTPFGVGDRTLAPGESAAVPTGWSVSSPIGVTLIVTGLSHFVEPFVVGAHTVETSVVLGSADEELHVRVTNRGSESITLLEGESLGRVVALVGGPVEPRFTERERRARV